MLLVEYTSRKHALRDLGTVRPHGLFATHGHCSDDHVYSCDHSGKLFCSICITSWHADQQPQGNLITLILSCTISPACMNAITACYAHIKTRENRLVLLHPHLHSQHPSQWNHPSRRCPMLPKMELSFLLHPRHHHLPTTLPQTPSTSTLWTRILPLV